MKTKLNWKVFTKVLKRPREESFALIRREVQVIF
jgi:hypothetical protein